MMAIIRIYVQENNPEDNLNNNDKIWEYIIENYKTWEYPNVKLLYITQQMNLNETSFIADINNTNNITDFLNTQISSQTYVKNFWVFNLLSPRFFPIPTGTPLEFSRYVATITAEPQKYNDIYRSVSKFEPMDDATITYLAYMYQPTGKDIITSIVAKNREAIEKFADRFITSIDGVKEIDINEVDRTKKLIPQPDWKEYIKPYTADLPGDSIKMKTDLKIEPWEYNEKFVCC
jgi:hypothetical protein